MSRAGRAPTYTAVNLWAIVWAAALCGAAGLIVVLPQGRLEPAGVLVCVAIIIMATIRTVVTVERHGVRVRIGIFGVPRRFLAMDEIERAIVVNVRPLRDFGGWGDRFRRSVHAYVCRRGEAVKLELVAGGSFIVTVDGARRVADRINAYVDESRATSARARSRPGRRGRRSRAPVF